MNPTTGEVRPFSLAYNDEGFMPVPPRLQREARKVIKTGGQVDLAGKSKLAKWARSKRKQQKASRKQNRK